MNIKTRTERQEVEQYWQYARDSVLPMLRMITIFAVAAQVIFMFEDWFGNQDEFWSLFTAKMISISVLIAAYLVTRTKDGKKYLDLSMIIVCISLVANISYQSSIIGATFMMPLVAILVTFVSASLFPWKLRYHIAVTFVCIFGVLVNMTLLQDPPYFPLTREAMSGVVFPATTILLAMFAHNRRFDLWLAERTVKESEERFRQVAENSADIIWIWAPDRRIEYVSPAYKKYTGRDSEELYVSPRKALEIIRKDDREVYGRALEDIMNGAERKMDMHICHTDGTVYFLEAWGSPIKDQNGKVIRCIGIWRDVTERVQLVKDLDFMATTDHLTKAYNRRFFFDVAEKEVKRAVRKQSPLSLLLFDIDKFKEVNDSYGHHHGDEVLIGISRVCQEMLRGEDVFARFGGEEFAVLLPEADLDEAVVIAERLRELVAEHTVSDKGKTISVTISIGVASWQSGKSLDINTLLNQADQAMYHSKAAGRDQVTVFTKEKVLQGELA